jgi:hypothetical protein
MKPLEAFTIRTASGESYPVSHPESIWQSPDEDTVIVAVKGGSVALMGVDHITEVVCPCKKSKSEAS